MCVGFRLRYRYRSRLSTFSAVIVPQLFDSRYVSNPPKGTSLCRCGRVEQSGSAPSVSLHTVYPGTGGTRACTQTTAATAAAEADYNTSSGFAFLVASPCACLQQRVNVLLAVGRFPLKSHRRTAILLVVYSYCCSNLREHLYVKSSKIKEH